MKRLEKKWTVRNILYDEKKMDILDIIFFLGIGLCVISLILNFIFMRP